jgi:hypothetical protein
VKPCPRPRNRVRSPARLIRFLTTEKKSFYLMETWEEPRTSAASAVPIPRHPEPPGERRVSLGGLTTWTSAFLRRRKGFQRRVGFQPTRCTPAGWSEAHAPPISSSASIWRRARAPFHISGGPSLSDDEFSFSCFYSMPPQEKKFMPTIRCGWTPFSSTSRSRKSSA